MKRIRYMATAVLLGALLVAPGAMAALPGAATGKTEMAGSTDFVRQENADDREAVRKMAETARKEIVARVNGVEINMYDLVGMMNRVADVYYRHVQTFDEAITREVKRRALDRLIFEQLAVEEAIRQGIEPKPGKVQKVIDNLRLAYGSEAAYQGYLDDIGLTEEGLEARIVRSGRLEGITGREVYQKVTVKEDAVKKAYEEYKEAGKLRRADEFVVKEILVMAGRNEEETHKRADELLAELERNEHDFGKLVLDGSFIVRKLRVNREKYPVIFEQMEGMEVGQYSGVVKDNGSLHIFKVLKNEPARDMTEEEARGFIEDRLAPYFQEQRRAEWMEELRKNAEIEILLDDLKNEPAADKVALGGDVHPQQ